MTCFLSVMIKCSNQLQLLLQINLRVEITIVDQYCRKCNNNLLKSNKGLMSTCYSGINCNCIRQEIMYLFLLHSKEQTICLNCSIHHINYDMYICMRCIIYQGPWIYFFFTIYSLVSFKMYLKSL